MIVSPYLKLVPLSRHSPLPELMNFVTLFRPLRVVPNTLDPSLNGLDWGVMSKMFSGCLSPASTPGSLESIMAPPCPLSSHPCVSTAPKLSTRYDLAGTIDKDVQVDAAYSNLVGPRDPADKWGDGGGKRAKMEVLKTWIGTRRRCGIESSRGELAVIAPRTSRRYARSDDSDDSSDGGGSDEHARTAWNFFGVGELEEGYKTWLSPSPQPQSRVQVEAAVDIGTLPTPISSPLLRERGLAGDNEGEEHARKQAPHGDLPSGTPTRPSLGRVPTGIVLPSVHPNASQSTSPFGSFDNARFSGQSSQVQTNEAVGSGSRPFIRLDDVVSDLSQEPVLSPHITQRQGQGQRSSWACGRTLSIITNGTKTVANTNAENVGEVPPLKRRKIDQEEPKDKVGERDGTCELSHEPSTGLTRTPTIASLSGGVDMDVSLPLTPTGPEMEMDSGTCSRDIPARAVTATATIPFPVRKRIEDGANHTGKTVLRGTPGCAVSSPRKAQAAGLGLTSCSTSAIVGSETRSGPHTKNRLVSPRTAARRAERAERRRITEKLRLARPDLVVPRRGSQSRVLERVAAPAPAVESASATTSMSPSTSARGRDIMEERAGGVEGATDETDEDTKIDWEKSRRLAERVREAVRKGDRASEVLPRLTCLERWYAERT